MNGGGPNQVHKAVISVLAGQVYPKPIWALRWRLQYFHFLRWLNQYVPLVPRRERFSLLATEPVSREQLRDLCEAEATIEASEPAMAM